MPLLIAWKTIFENKKRSLIICGSIVVILTFLFVEIGILQGMKSLSTRFYQNIDFDFVIISDKYRSLTTTGDFHKSILKKIRWLNGIDDVMEVNMSRLYNWKNLDTNIVTKLFVFSLPQQSNFIKNDNIKLSLPLLKSKNHIIMDSESFKVAGEIYPGKLGKLNNHEVSIASLFKFGNFLITESTGIVSPELYYTLNPINVNLINLGFIKLKPSANRQETFDLIKANLGKEVELLSHEGIIDKTIAFYIDKKPTGIAFKFGCLIALVVSVIVIYQAITNEIKINLNEYATLKAIGFNKKFIYFIAFNLAWLYSFISFVITLIFCFFIFQILDNLLPVPMNMTIGIIFFVLISSFITSSISTLFALRQFGKADPADLF